MENLKKTESNGENGKNCRLDKTYKVIITITVLVALALLIFAVYKVFSNYPFTLPPYIAFYVVILTLFVFFFPLTRTYLEYRTLKFLAKHCQLKSYVDQFLKDSSSSEDSIIAVKGEVRLVIALTIILILAIALFQLIATTGADDFVKSILGVLTGAITSITAFYFGARTSQEGGAKPKDTPKAQGDEQHIIDALSTLSGL
jgi:hypothetical protein